MRRRGRIGLVLLALVVLVPPIAVAAFAALFDADALKTRAADAVRRSTGRELTIAGPVGLTWSLIPTIVLNDVSLSNPPGMSRPALAHAARVEIRVALLPLLSRQLELRGVTLVGPDVLLERDAAGQPNWLLTPIAAPPVVSAPPAVSGPRMRVSVDAVRVRNGQIAWRDGANVHVVAVPTLTAAGAGPASPVELSGTLGAVGLSLGINGTVGPLAAIGAGAWPLQVALEGSGVQGTVSGALGPDGAMAVSIKVADPAVLAPLLGRAPPPLRDVALDARVSITAAGDVALRAMRLTLPQGDLAGDVVVGWKPRPSVRGALASQRLNLDAFAAALPAALPAPAPATPALPQTPAPPPATRLLPDAPLPFDALLRADADLQVAFAEVLWRKMPFHAVSGRLLLQDGRLRVDPLQAQAPGGAVQALVQADATATPPTAAVALQAPGMEAGPLLAALGVPELTTGRTDADIQLKGAGISVRAIAASLDGHAGLAMVDGELDNRWLAGLFGDALRGLPVDLKGRSAVRCLALRFDVAAGQATARALLLDASRLHLEGDGSVNLGDETLDLRLRTMLRLGATSVAVPVHLAGPWRSPRPQVAIAGGEQGALVIGAPPGPDTCPAQLAVARDGRPGPTPATNPMPAEALHVPKPADLLRGLLR
jgi:AsmA protein